MKCITQINVQNKIFFDYIWCDVLVELMNSKSFYNKMKFIFTNYKEKEKSYIIFYLYHQIFTKVLKVNNNIMKQVNNFISKFHNSYIGIQIRVGNADLKEKQFCTSTDIDIMLEFAKRNKNYKKWFVTGDSYKLKNKLKRIYKRIILFSKNITKHYAKNTKDSITILEHEILSKSNFIIISASTYGFTALLKSGLLLKKEDLGYEIKKGRIYNTKINFKNITPDLY